MTRRPLSQRAAPRLAAALFAAMAVLPACRRAEALPSPPTLTLRLAQDPATLDPAHAADEHSVAVVSQIFDGLVEFDPDDLSVRPALAERWEISADGLRYTFHLRPGARFHDGRPVTAADVAWSFQRLLSPATRSERRWVLEALAGMKVADDRTIELTLERPFTPFLSLLCLEGASIVPRGIDAAAGGLFARHPIGAGPFALESWAPGERIVLRRAATALRAPPGLVRRIVYRVIASESTALEEYLAGGLDVANEVPIGRRRELRDRLAGQYRRWAQPAIAYIGFNHVAAPFRGNRALRQALNHAVDKDFICDVLNEGKDLPASGVIPRGVPGFDAELRGYPYDPGRARALLAEAGYPGGRGLPEVTLYYNTSESQRRIMERVQIDLSRVGVRARLKSLDPAALMKSLEAGEAALFRMAWLADYPDPEAILRPTLHSASRPAEGNYSRYANPEFDRLIDRAREASNPAERAALYRRAHRIAVDDACWLFLYFHGDEALVKPRVRDLRLPALGDFLAPLSAVSLKQDEGPDRDPPPSRPGS